MKVILLERVEGRGALGDVVLVVLSRGEDFPRPRDRREEPDLGERERQPLPAEAPRVAALPPVVDRVPRGVERAVPTREDADHVARQARLGELVGAWLEEARAYVETLPPKAEKEKKSLENPA